MVSILLDKALNYKEKMLSVAPMMDWTDSHCRVFHRLLAPGARLYTEMVHANAVLQGDRARLLARDASENPVALQLGGSDPALLAQAARVGQEHGFDEVNLNVGCPSDRVQAGRFGACLMKEPTLVADCVAAMIESVAGSARYFPVTVKCRLGVDEEHDYDRFAAFIDTVAAAGCRIFFVHARNAWLQGLSPKENREVPPLRYDWAYRLKRERPALTIAVNGGIATVEDSLEHLRHITIRTCCTAWTRRCPTPKCSRARSCCAHCDRMWKTDSPTASRSSTSPVICLACSTANLAAASSARC
jgi:tRNA-dihydrouridine synthase A